MDCRSTADYQQSKSVVRAPGGAEWGACRTVATMEEAVALIRPVDRIGFGLGPGIPDGLLTALGTRTDWEDLQIGGALCLNLYEVFTRPGVTLPLRLLRAGGAAASLPGPPGRAGARGASAKWGRSWPGSLLG